MIIHGGASFEVCLMLILVSFSMACFLSRVSGSTVSHPFVLDIMVTGGPLDGDSSVFNVVFVVTYEGDSLFTLK